MFLELLLLASIAARTAVPPQQDPAAPETVAARALADDLCHVPADSFLLLRLDPRELLGAVERSAVGRAARGSGLAPVLRELQGPFLLVAEDVMPGLSQESLQSILSNLDLCELGVRGLVLELGNERHVVRPGQPPDARLVNAVLAWITRSRLASLDSSQPGPEPLLVGIDGVLRLPPAMAGQLPDRLQRAGQEIRHSELLGRDLVELRIETPVPGLFLRLDEWADEHAVWWSGSRETLEECLSSPGVPLTDRAVAAGLRSPTGSPWALGFLDVGAALELLRPLVPPSLLASIAALGVGEDLMLSFTASSSGDFFHERFTVHDLQGPLATLLEPAAPPVEGTPRLKSLSSTPSSAAIYLGVAVDPQATLRSFATAFDTAMGDGGALRSALLQELGLDSIETWVALEAFGGEGSVFGTTVFGPLPDAVLRVDVGVRSTLESILQRFVTEIDAQASRPSNLPAGSDGLRLADSEGALSFDVLWNDERCIAGQTLHLRRWQRQLERLTPETSLAAAPGLNGTFEAFGLGAGEQVPFLLRVDLSAMLSSIVPTLFAAFGSGEGNFDLVAILEDLRGFPPITLAVEQGTDSLSLVLEEPLPASAPLAVFLWELLFLRLTWVQFDDGAEFVEVLEPVEAGGGDGGP